jgi:alpha-amylase
MKQFERKFTLTIRRIYADVVFNHMTGGGGSQGTGGTISNTAARQYQEVPYGPDDFNTPCAITNYNDAIQV